MVSNNGKEMIPSVYTLVVYEQEFERDMIHDLFSGIPTDGQDGIEAIANIDWMTALRCLWALERSNDSKTPSFVEWSKKQKEVHLMGIFESMLPEITDAFFRAKDSND